METKEVVFEGHSINIPKLHKFVARDADGSIYSYKNPPTLHGREWVTNGSSDYRRVVDMELPWNESVAEYA